VLPGTAKRNGAWPPQRMRPSLASVHGTGFPKAGGVNGAADEALARAGVAVPCTDSVSGGPSADVLSPPPPNPAPMVSGANRSRPDGGGGGGGGSVVDSPRVSFAMRPALPSAADVQALTPLRARARVEDRGIVVRSAARGRVDRGGEDDDAVAGGGGGAGAALAGKTLLAGYG